MDQVSNQVVRAMPSGQRWLRGRQKLATSDYLTAWRVLHFRFESAVMALSLEARRENGGRGKLAIPCRNRTWTLFDAPDLIEPLAGFNP